MSTIEMTDSNISDIAANNRYIVIDIWAEWCAPCRRFGPRFEKASESFENVVFAKVNADENPGILEHFQIQGIPAILIVKDSQLVIHHRGIMTEANLQAAILKVVGTK